ncbi:MAG: hypothetical protein JXC32_04780, partial [Anaerolineae bacterium]|nr:hypothetical protein [Anaerolineae bacterium]
MPSPLDNLQSALTMLSFEAIWSALTYPWQKARAQAEWTPEGERIKGLKRSVAYGAQAVRLGRGSGSRPAWPKTWQRSGAIRYVHLTDRGVRLSGAEGTIEVALLASDLVRIRYLRPGADADAEPMSYAIQRPLATWSIPPFVCIQHPTACLLQTSDLVVGITLASSQVFFATPDGALMHSDVEAAWADNGALRHRVALAPGERIFGLGERATPHNRRGRTHVLWNTDPAGYRSGDDPINLNMPVSVHIVPAGDGRKLSSLTFYDNPTYAEFDLGSSIPNVAEHRFAGGELRYYFAVGPLPQLLERYTELTGRHPLQPLWMLGYHQSRWSYDTEARIRKLARDFREQRVPCDAIHLDIDYMEGFRCFTWDRRSCTEPALMAADLREMGIKLISIIDPGIKRDPDYEVYREGLAGGHFCTTPDGQVFHAPVWPGYSAFPDFTNPATRRWWGQLYRPLLETGIAGFWNDMNEPSAFAAIGDRTLPDTVRHAMEGAGGTHAEAHNIYGMQMVRATREGLEA